MLALLGVPVLDATSTVPSKLSQLSSDCSIENQSFLYAEGLSRNATDRMYSCSNDLPYIRTDDPQSLMRGYIMGVDAH